MSPIQQMLLGVGAVATKTYVDDIFSTYVYKGDGNSSRNITNNIDLLTEGGLVWYKSRSAGKGHRLVDTERGVTKVIESNDSNAEAVEATGLKAFLTNGFTVGSDDTINESGGDQGSWSFRKAPGFFDVVTYTGNGTAGRTLSHSLGCVPGLVLIKQTNSTQDWVVYHRSLDTDKKLKLNGTGAEASTSSWNSTRPTSTTITLGAATGVNGTSHEFVAYLFAGGESTASTAVSGDFDGTNDKLYLADHADWALGQTFTIEFWINPDNNSHYGGIVSQTNMSNQGWYIYLNQTKVDFHDYNGNQCLGVSNSIKAGQWTHCALVNNSGTAQWYINGIPNGSSSTVNIGNYSLNLEIGNTDSSNYFNGKISNLRIVKGTAVYTSAFKPPTEPLTNITNTKLLCLQNSSNVDAYTVAPGNISEDGSPGPALSTDSPFDDPAAHVFGESGSESVIKCGSYVGNGSESDGTEVFLGWEPQWLMVKRTDGSDHWGIIDVMRGWVADGQGNVLFPNRSNQEDNGANSALPISTGFKLHTTNSEWNGSGNEYIFVALRRPDGYCGKPIELGSDCFQMDAGNGNTTQAFDSAFPVDFALERESAATCNWEAGGRLIQGKYLQTNSTQAESAASYFTFDSNTGWLSGAAAYSSSYQSWMWKRHAGMDVVTYEGTGTTQHINHSLNKTVEMAWFKRRNATQNWGVYHKGLNSGSNPEDYYLVLNGTNAETGGSSNTDKPLASAPTSTHIEVLGSSSFSNSNGSDYIAMLFASVDGISKVGSYTGNGSTTGTSVTTGFTVRFLIIKSVDGDSWIVIDTLREFTSTDSKYLQLNTTGGQEDITLVKQITNGFQLSSTFSGVNSSGQSYIYYAHA